MKVLHTKHVLCIRSLKISDEELNKIENCLEMIRKSAALDCYLRYSGKAETPLTPPTDQILLRTFCVSGINAAPARASFRSLPPKKITRVTPFQAGGTWSASTTLNLNEISEILLDHLQDEQYLGCRGSTGEGTNEYERRETQAL